jgi:DNA repair protein RecO (recombination protein O)
MSRDPKYQKVHAIILSRKPLREADYLLTVYTRERGKIRVLARGVRKQNAKLASRLQQLYNVELYLAGNGIWPVVTSVSVVEKYAKLRQNLSALSLAFYASELVTKLTPDEESNLRIYDLLHRFLSELSRTYKKIDFEEMEKAWPPILEKFRLDLLRIIGHGVTVRFCAHCGIKVAPASPVGFSCFAGGIVHADCGKHFPDTKNISDITAGQLALLDQQALEDVSDLLVNEEGHKSLSNFVVFLLERDVQSERFLEKVRDEN